MRGEPIPDLRARLETMSGLIAHRGPDDAGVWAHERGHVGFGHRRLAIIDPTPAGHQPMRDDADRWLTYNGEIYNYPELRSRSGAASGPTATPRSCMRAHDRWGADSLDRLRGMFAYALWDEREQELLCARDRFGIKPFYYAQVGDVLHFASEAKALLPFLPAIRTDVEGLKDYLAFQFCLAGKTLFEGVRELLPGHRMRIRNGRVTTERYWEVYYDLDFDHTANYFEERIEALLGESVALHLRSDVPVSAYLSGGLDSSSVASLASDAAQDAPEGVHRPLPRGRALRRERVRARAGRRQGPRPAPDRHRRERLPRARSSTSSTTWTTPRPGRARSRSTWSPRPRRASRR